MSQLELSNVTQIRLPLIKEEWVRLHNIIVHENPTEAYKQLTKIISRMVTRKLEAKETIDVTTRHIIVKMWKPEDEPTS